MPKHRAECCHTGFVGVISVGCSFFTALGRSLVFSVEAHSFCKFPRGLCEPLAFAIKIGCQNVNCPGCLTGMLKVLVSIQKDKCKDTHTPKKVYSHNVLESTRLPSMQVLPYPARHLWLQGYSKHCVPGRLQRLLLLPRYSEIRWSSCSFRATGANQEEGKTRYKCASGCAENQLCCRAAPRAMSHCCSTGLTPCSLALTVSLDSMPSL